MTALAVTLAACGPAQPSEPPQVLVDAVDASETYLAALDSTAGETRDLAQGGPGGTAPDIQDLPGSDETYIAICVSELPEGNLLKSKYAAMWLTEGSTATGFVAVWNP
jgi:hypothetical protein